MMKRLRICDPDDDMIPSVSTMFNVENKIRELDPFYLCSEEITIANLQSISSGSNPFKSE